MAPLRISMTTPLRRNRFWLALLVVLTMVFSMGGTPALALACGEISRSTAPVASNGSRGCHEQAASGHCCCGPSAAAKTASSAHTAHAAPTHNRTSAKAALNQAGCGCAVQAPTTPPASSLKAATLLLTQDLAFLPGSPTVISLSAPAIWSYAVSANGPPRSQVRSSGPSRAPPAC